MTPPDNCEPECREEIMAIIGKLREEWAVAKVILERLEKDLFGNGQPGVVTKLDIRVTALENKYWLAIGALIILQFLTGSGVISLTKVLGK